MNKTFTLLVLMLTILSGCASLDKKVQSYTDNSYKLAKDGSGIVYGAFGIIEDSTAKQMCEATKNVDLRCEHPEDYVGIQVYSAMGFMAAGAIAPSLERKDSPNLTKNFTNCSRVGNGNCPFAKVQTKEGQFGTIVEVVSVNGDKKCYWDGYPRGGGTVCPAYHWDYRKNLNNWNTTNGVMTVYDKEKK